MFFGFLTSVVLIADVEFSVVFSLLQSQENRIKDIKKRDIIEFESLCITVCFYFKNTDKLAKI